MTQRAWRSISAAERSTLWERWKAGQSMEEIARALERHRSSVREVIAARGGFAPGPRRRSHRALSLGEREEISRGVCASLSMREIARRLGRWPSTVSRELKRHGGGCHYRAAVADGQAWDRARRPKSCLLAGNRRLRERVAEKLALQWSPQQIAGWLEEQFPADHSMRVSHETIYRSLFIQARGALKKQLLAQLRSRRKLRRSRQAHHADEGRGQIVDAISIRERPAEVEDRAVPGHWEGDLLVGGKHTQIATLVERRSRFVMLVKVATKDTATVTKALSRHVRKLPAELRRSLTWDRGLELAAHKSFTVATDVQVYFCDPHSPWQRGSNENTNGLLRQYFPKGRELSGYSQAYLNRIALRLNQRPRQTLGFKTPADILHATVASIG
jgi:IS30 family transposase